MLLKFDKDTCNLRQFRSVACREYTLPRDDPASEAKGWIQGNMRIGLVFEVTTSCQHFKYGIEILNQFKTTQKFLQNHKKSEYHKQTSRLLQPDQRQKQNHNREYSLVQQQPYQCTKEDGLTLSHQNKILLRTIFRRK